MKTLKVLLAVMVLGALGAAGFIWLGVYPIGADVPHTRLVYWLLETARERSIAARIKGIDVPPLDDSQMLLAGGADYNDMCAGCHLKPGRSASDMSVGLYPKPPNLAQAAEDHGDGHDHGDAEISAARQFWIIKHGIKASAMPAWGPTHDDARIWAMVAFLRRLPTLTPAQYQILTARGEGDAGHEAHDLDPAAAPQAEPESDGGHAGMEIMKPSRMMSAGAAGTALDAADAFAVALKSGEREAALAWLAPDVLIYEGGSAERSRDEYAAHHLQADMAFLGTAQVERLKRRSGESGDTAWVTTESRIRGKSSKGGALDVLSTETALLRKAAQGWRITHLHWSSQDSQPQAENAK